jgi:ABC-type lipoprotein export system ATPase subunit
VGLAERIDFLPEQLSGGQRQRVAIARALANDAPLILADEPTGALHSDDKQVIVELLQGAHRRGHTIVVVTHDPAIAETTDRRIEIRDGRLHALPPGS